MSEAGEAGDSAIESRKQFFRQSGWMVIAMTLGGVFNFAQNILAERTMTNGQFGVFLALLRLMPLVAIPTAGLWTIFARQGASAVTAEARAEFAATVRVVVAALLGLWLALAGGVWVWRKAILEALQIQGFGLPLALAVVAVLTTLLAPVVRGVLQGASLFGGLGASVLSEGLGRFLLGLAVIGIIGLGWLAESNRVSGFMAATLLGQVLAIGVAAFVCRDLLKTPGTRVNWRVWLSSAIPLTVGSGMMSLLMNYDLIFVRTTFPKDWTDLYSKAWMVGFALSQFTVPIAMVMFPRIVRSKALARKTDALEVTLIATASVGGLAAVASTIIPWLPARILAPNNPEIARLIPWFAWAMLLVTLANVLVGNLMGQQRFGVIPWVVLVGAGYVAGLILLKPTLLAMDAIAGLRVVVQCLGSAALLLCAGGAWFTRGRRSGNSPETEQT